MSYKSCVSHLFAALQSQLDTSSTGALASSLMSFTPASGMPVPPPMMELLLSSMRAGGRSSAGMASPAVSHQGLPATLAGNSHSHLPSVPGNQVGVAVRLGVCAGVKSVQGVPDPRECYLLCDQQACMAWRLPAQCHLLPASHHESASLPAGLAQKYLNLPGQASTRVYTRRQK